MAFQYFSYFQLDEIKKCQVSRAKKIFVARASNHYQYYGEPKASSIIIAAQTFLTDKFTKKHTFVNFSNDLSLTNNIKKHHYKTVTQLVLWYNLWKYESKNQEVLYIIHKQKPNLWRILRRGSRENGKVMYVIKTKFLLKPGIYNLTNIITKPCTTKKTVFHLRSVKNPSTFPAGQITQFLWQKSITPYPSMIFQKFKQHMNKRVSHKKLERANKKLNIQMSATRLLQTLVNQTYVQTFFSFLCFPSTVTKKSFWLPCKNAYKEKQRSIHGTSYSK